MPGGVETCALLAMCGLRRGSDSLTIASGAEPDQASLEPADRARNLDAARGDQHGYEAGIEGSFSGETMRLPRPYPWLRSVEESVPRKQRDDHSITGPELLAVLVVVAAVIAMAVWFFFFSGGGIGPGTV